MFPWEMEVDGELSGAPAMFPWEMEVDGESSGAPAGKMDDLVLSPF
jgi:hypothetical protein